MRNEAKRIISPNRSTTSDSETSPATSPEMTSSSTSWSPKFRLLVSFLVILHVTAVFAEPFRFFTRSSQRLHSPDAGLIRGWLSPYIDFAYLHHGYFFFAPNPGPSHLISAQLGPAKPPHKPREVVIPDKTTQWPRLYYHRHFMLSEFLHNSFAPPEQPIEATTDPYIMERWKIDRGLYIAISDSIKNHFKKTENVTEVEIRRVEHLLPNDIQVYQEKWKLTDPRLYILLPESLSETAPASLPGDAIRPTSPEISLPAQTSPGAEVLEEVP